MSTAEGVRRTVARGGGRPAAGRRHVNGVLHLYRRVLGRADATTVMEHVDCFQRHSQFRCWNLNTEFGMPPALRGLSFSAVVVHYSVFGAGGYALDEDFRGFLADNCDGSYKIAFFQDEYHFCRDRFAFLNEFEFDCVFSCLEEGYLDQVYGRNTGVRRLVSCIPGYVSGELPRTGRRFGAPVARRSIDVGYRGRMLPSYFGRGGQEKFEIGAHFQARAQDQDLVLDIGSREQDRIYGNDWYRFVGSCRAVLGTESGVSMVDLEDEVYGEYQRLQETGGEVSVEQLEKGALGRLEGRIEYRTIGPRHFEAAALGTCQILYEGRYSGAMEPMVHYIPLNKDFSNFDQVLERFRDADLRRELSENAYRDLIDSGEYSYARFVAGFDRILRDAGIEPGVSADEARAVNAALQPRRRYARAYAHHLVYHREFLGRGLLQRLARPLVRAGRRLRGNHAG